MLSPTRLSPKNVDKRQGPRSGTRPVNRRGECSTFVDLARRMNISADDAIRQYIDMGRR